MAFRGETVVQVTAASGPTFQASEVNELSTRGGRARLLASHRGGEAGRAPFTSPNLSGTSVWVARGGYRLGTPPSFWRIERTSGRLTSVPAHLQLGSYMARDERGALWYVQAPDPDVAHNVPCNGILQPCHIVRASASPFSARARTLPPTVRVTSPALQFVSARADAPLVLVGDVGRSVVRNGTAVARQPLRGLQTRLVRTDLGASSPIVETGLAATTDDAGRFEFALATPPGSSVFVIAAPSLRISSWRISLTSFAS
jgi:hypothetical protein